MSAGLKGTYLVGMGILVVFSGEPVHAAEGTLLVVVEAPPALDADAAEIRRAIATELRSQTIAPMQRGAEPPGRALIVAFDRDRIAMSLRTNDATTPIVRDIPAPTDRAARLRAIAWLAGNLARDQVTPIVAQAPAETTPLATIPSIAPAPATEPPPLPSPTASPATAVPAAPVTETAAETVATTGRVAPPENANGPYHWSITFADGPTANMDKEQNKRIAGTAWHLDAQRYSGNGGFLLGAALSGTNGDFAPQGIGTSVFVGSASRFGRWNFEATAGAGVELGFVSVTSVTATHSSANGFESTATQADAVRPGLLADAGVAVAHPLWQSVDAVVRLGAHLSTLSLDSWFLTTALGLRYNLQ
jgi:hypothetical protein